MKNRLHVERRSVETEPLLGKGASVNPLTQPCPAVDFASSTARLGPVHRWTIESRRQVEGESCGANQRVHRVDWEGLMVAPVKCFVGKWGKNSRSFCSGSTECTLQQRLKTRLSPRPDKLVHTRTVEIVTKEFARFQANTRARHRDAPQGSTQLPNLGSFAPHVPG